MKQLILWMSVLYLAGTMVLWAAPVPNNPTANLEATFLSLTGNVTIKNKKGVPRTAKETSTVPEGSTVITSADGEASLKMFDGSVLKIKPNSSVVVTTLQQPSLTDKILKFKLIVGQIFASVKKLTTSKSSFETEAGGVICGVRGTEYSMFFDPATGKVNVVVLDGAVWVTSGGQTIIYHGGQSGNYTNGNPDKTDQGGQNGQGGQGSNGGTNNYFGTNPFYGFTGNGTDDFNGILTDPDQGTGEASGRVGDDGLGGLNGYMTHALNLQLNFPQYLSKNPGSPAVSVPASR